MKKDGILHTSGKDHAEILNGQFESVFTVDDGSPAPELNGEGYPCISPCVIMEEGIHKLLAGLNVNKASGLDEIPCWLLTELDEELTPIYRAFVEQSLNQCEVPKDWK